MPGNFLDQLSGNPHGWGWQDAIPAAPSVTYDEYGQPWLNGQKLQQPDPSLTDSLWNIGESPAKMATALAGSLSPYGPEGWQVPPAASVPVNALMRLVGTPSNPGTFAQGPDYPGNSEDMRTLLEAFLGGNAVNPAAAIPENALGMFGSFFRRKGNTPDVIDTSIPSWAPLQSRSNETTSRSMIQGMTRAANSGASGLSAGMAETTLPPLPKSPHEYFVRDAPPVSRLTDPERIARAKAQGFDTDTAYYHGTQRYFDAFDPNASAATERNMPSVYLAPDPSIASMYSRETDGSMVYPTYVRKGNHLEIDAAGTLPYHELAAAKEAGYDSVLAKNVPHSVDAYGNPTVAHDELVVFDPANIRSVNAVFDPANIGKNGLLFSDNLPSLWSSALQGQQQPYPNSLFGY